MRKVLGLAVVVVGLWASMTIYLDGIEGLTGKFASSASQDSGDGEAAEPSRTMPQRFGDRVDAEMRKREQDADRRLGQLDDF